MNHAYNHYEIPSPAHGGRSITTLTAGRKWVTVIDWTTLETARIGINLWQMLKPQLHGRLNLRKVGTVMRRRLKYVTSTGAIQEALRLLQETEA